MARNKERDRETRHAYYLAHKDDFRRRAKDWAAKNRKTKRRWTLDWERTAMVQAYLAGEKIESIAAEFGVSKTTPGNLAFRRGHPRRRQLQVQPISATA